MAGIECDLLVIEKIYSIFLYMALQITLTPKHVQAKP